MPKDKDLKKLVRDRMAKTGEAYSVGRHHLLARQPGQRVGNDATGSTIESVGISNALPRCLYCLATLDADTRFAHVVPECLGGRIGSKEICCSDCNNAFAALESLLCEALRPVGASVGALTGDRKPVTHVREVDGAKFEFWDGRGRRRLDPPTFDKAAKKLSFPLPAGEEAQAQRMAEQMWQHGFTPADLDNGKFTIEPQANPIPANLGQRWVENVFNIGDRGHRRVFVKMALELLAKHDSVAARRIPLSAARQFAREDLGNIGFKVDATSVGTGLLAKVKARFRIGHSVEVWTSGRHLLVRVVFFGQLIFTTSLTSTWDGRPFSIAHILDPQDPAEALTRMTTRGGKPLALWHEGMAKDAIAAFQDHVEAVACEKGNAAAATPIERPPAPVLDAAMKERIRIAFEAIVAKRGRRSPRKRTSTAVDSGGAQ